MIFHWGPHWHWGCQGGDCQLMSPSLLPPSHTALYWTELAFPHWEWVREVFHHVLFCLNDDDTPHFRHHITPQTRLTSLNLTDLPTRWEKLCPDMTCVPCTVTVTLHSHLTLSNQSEQRRALTVINNSYFVVWGDQGEPGPHDNQPSPLPPTRLINTLFLSHC